MKVCIAFGPSGGSSGSVCCEHNNEISGSAAGDEFRGQLTSYKIL
jgi:hypothetical protein